MRFSIIISTIGGREDLLAMAIRSTLAQSYEDYEVVVVDGKSSFETKRAVLSHGDTRVKYHAVTLEKGGFYTFEHGARVAQGDYFLWLDDDNYLLPFALELFSRAIDKYNYPDIVTASHFYFYDDKHPRHYLRQHMGIVPWTGAVSVHDPRELIRALYHLKPRGAGSGLPRLHTSATAIKRKVVQDTQVNIGFIVIADMPNMHSMQPILYSFADKCVYVDHPMMIVGRFGISMSQSWSTSAKARFIRKPLFLQESPLGGNTKINSVLENYLRVKKLMPHKLADIEPDYLCFAVAHIRELAYLDNSIFAIMQDWRKTFAFLYTLPYTSRQNILVEARKLYLKSIFIYIARRLRLHYIWRSIFGILCYRKEDKKSSIEKLKTEKEFEISYLDYKVRTIEDLGVRAREIILKELDKDIFILDP